MAGKIKAQSKEKSERKREHESVRERKKDKNCARQDWIDFVRGRFRFIA